MVAMDGSGRRVTSRAPFKRCSISDHALELAALHERLRSLANRIPERLDPEANQELVVATAREILDSPGLPDWVGLDTRYLVIVDVPEPAILRLPAALHLRKPEQRLHVTRDAQAVKRLVISFARDEPWQGILDAYVLEDRLVVVLGDFRIAEFPQDQLPSLSREAPSLLGDFELDPSGSYLHWPSVDVHLGASQLLQAVDPMYLADVEIERYARAKVSLALLEIREEEGLRQRDIEGLSERHVRRLEREEARLTPEAAGCYAATFGCSLPEFLTRLARKISELRDREAEQRARDGEHARRAG